MLSQRIIGAFTFRRGVYAEVENDTTFTTTAWLIVAVVAFLNQVGTSATPDIVPWAISAVAGTIFAIIGFAVAALVINWVGRSVFNAEVTFDELVRTMGLAYVWNIIGVIGVVTILSETLVCLVAPILLITTLALIAAWFLAIKEALDLEWVQTIVTVVIGWIVMFAIVFVGGLILAALGIGAAAIGGAFG